MYVYLQSEPTLWTVGYYDPSGKWQPQSDHGTEREARAEVAYLNGDGQQLAAEVTRLKAEVERLRTLIGAKLSLFDSEIDDLLAQQVDL